MKVKELIRRLEIEDPEREVRIFCGYEFPTLPCEEGLDQLVLCETNLVDPDCDLFIEGRNRICLTFMIDPSLVKRAY